MQNATNIGPSLRVRLNGRHTIESLIELGDYDQVEPNFYRIDYALPRCKDWDISVQAFQARSHRAVSLVRELTSPSIRPANVFETLVFGADPRRVYRGEILVALGSLLDFGRGCYEVPFLANYDGARKLGLMRNSSYFCAQYRYLVARCQPT